MTNVIAVDFVLRKRVTDADVELERSRACMVAGICPRCFEPLDVHTLLAIIPANGVAYHVECFCAEASP